MSANHVPFLDLVTPHLELEQELTNVFHQALRTAGFIGGPKVAEFETAFAKACDTQHSVAVSSGTDALRFAIMAAGVRSGDVVLTVPHTFIATTEAIVQAGALPEFVDIDERTYNLDPAELRAYLETQCLANDSGRRVSKRSGQPMKYYHDVEGYNGRLDAIQAGLLLVKLAHLAKWNKQRRERAAEYNRLLANAEDVIRPFEPSWSRANYHLYVVRVQDQQGLIAHLKQADIHTGIHYPIPLHLQKAYKHLGYARGAFPKAEKVAAEIVSLPMFPQLTEQQQARVTEEIRNFVGSGITEIRAPEPLVLEQTA